MHDERDSNLKESENFNGAIRLLYLVPHELWPANSGARQRDLQLARQLALRCSVTFVEMRHRTDKKALPGDFGFEQIVTLNRGRSYTPYKILRGLLGPTPMTIWNYWSRRSNSQLAGVLKSRPYHTIQIEGVHLLKYLPIVRSAVGFSAIVVDWHNVESELMSRYAEITPSWTKKIVARRTAKQIERAEDCLLGMRCTHTVTSQREYRLLKSRHPAANIKVIPNGIDTRFFAEEILEEIRCRSGSDLRQTILFVGSMDYHANVEGVVSFVRDAWPEIAQNNPNLDFLIAGRNPTREVRELASNRVHVTGTVDDVRPFYASALAVVVPLRSGSGTRLKILEAMAAGVPIVSTRLGAEGIDAQDDVHLLLADSPREIVMAVGRLVSSLDLRMRLSKAGRLLVRRSYDWATIGKQLYKMHADLASSRPHIDIRRNPD